MYFSVPVEFIDEHGCTDGGAYLCPSIDEAFALLDYPDALGYVSIVFTPPVAPRVRARRSTT